MCGRFSFTMDMDELQEAFPGVDFGLYFDKSYNIAPSQNIMAITNVNSKNAGLFHWGLIPSWSKDKKIGYKMINARSETLAEKPSFKNAYKKQRCLIPADGFYEWKKETTTKTPFHIRMKSGKPFAFAGLWEKWQNPTEGIIYSCTIITTEANSLVKQVHHRMPVILAPEKYDVWLDPEIQQPAELGKLLVPFDADKMTSYPVSAMVNSPKNNTPDCVKPVIS